MKVSTHLLVDDEAAAASALADHGLAPADDGPLVAVIDRDVAAGEVAEVLGTWIAALRSAMEAGVDVVTVLGDDHLEGDDVGRLTVGHGVIGGSRSYAFEGQRDRLAANVVVGRTTGRATLDTARWVLESGTLAGQVLLTGTQLHGRQRP